MDKDSTNEGARRLHKLSECKSLPDMVYVAWELYDAVLTMDADEAIESSTPLLWQVAEELTQGIDPVEPTNAEAFGVLLALRSIVQYPEVLQLAARRALAHLEELIDVKVVLSDQETLVTVLPAVAERLLEQHPELGKQRAVEHTALKPYATLIHSPGLDGTDELAHVPKVRMKGKQLQVRIDGTNPGCWRDVVETLSPSGQPVVILSLSNQVIIMHSSEFDAQLNEASHE